MNDYNHVLYHTQSISQTWSRQARSALKIVKPVSFSCMFNNGVNRCCRASSAIWYFRYLGNCAAVVTQNIRHQSFITRQNFIVVDSSCKKKTAKNKGILRCCLLHLRLWLHSKSLLLFSTERDSLMIKWHHILTYTLLPLSHR